MISNVIPTFANDIYKCPWSTDFLYALDNSRFLEQHHRVQQYAVKFHKANAEADKDDAVSIKGGDNDAFECDAFYCDINMIQGCSIEPVWIVVPTKAILMPNIISKLGTGELSRIDVMTLNRTSSDEKDSQFTIKTKVSFASCKILRTICSFCNIFVFCSTYGAIKIKDTQYDLSGSDNGNKQQGQAVCTIDYTSGSVKVG